MNALSDSMKRIRRLCLHPLYQEQTALLQEAEKERIFCRHTMEHFLDVARLMYIYNLEDGAGIDKELIYAAALLHDIGRLEQLIHGTPHHIAGARIADMILPECGFSPEDIEQIRQAITAHRSEESLENNKLSLYLYQADKQSRCCFLCPAANQCNWPPDKKNDQIRY